MCKQISMHANGYRNLSFLYALWNGHACHFWRMYVCLCMPSSQFVDIIAVRCLFVDKKTHIERESEREYMCKRRVYRKGFSLLWYGLFYTYRFMIKVHILWKDALCTWQQFNFTFVKTFLRNSRCAVVYFVCIHNLKMYLRLSVRYCL